MAVAAPGTPGRQSTVAQYGAPADQVTQASFARALLQGLGAPLTKANVASMVQWENKEGGNWSNTAAYNPLNTTRSMPGSSSIPGNSAGVQAYTSWSQGLNATIATLQQPAYTDVVSAFRSGGGLSGSYAGLHTWSGGGYDSLTGTSSVVHGGTNPTTNTTPASGQGPSEWLKLLVDGGLLLLGGAFLYTGSKRMISGTQRRPTGNVAI